MKVGWKLFADSPPKLVTDGSVHCATENESQLDNLILCIAYHQTDISHLMATDLLAYQN